jgi:hypothetical protein
MPSLADDILSKTTSEEQWLYLKSLFTNAKITLKENEGADELLPALVEFLKKNYKPEALTLDKLLDLYQYLYTWRTHEKEMNGYIFATVQSALLHIISEPLNKPLKEPLERMHQECVAYINDLQEQLKKDPRNKQTPKKIDILSTADKILQEEDDPNPIKATLFFKFISDNQAIFEKDQHPRAKLFLKTVAVFMAFCLGAGIGGVFAYQKLFHQKNPDAMSVFETKLKEELFRLSIFQPSPEQNPDNSLKPGQDSDIKP